MLCLRHGHAIARHKHHRACGFQQEVGVLGRDGTNFARHRSTAATAGRGRTKAAEEHVRQRTVHGLAHNLREDDTARADQ